MKRLTREMDNITKDPPEGVSVSMENGNIYKWDAIITGPQDSPYEGGIFRLNITFPVDYPFRPPEVTFITKVYHPNINFKGDICLDILKEQWSAALTVRSVLVSLCSLLNEPNPANPLVAEIANIYKQNRAKFNNNARQWTREYAS